MDVLPQLGDDAIVDTTAVALYLQYWSAFTSAPQWLLALVALAVVLAVNLVAVKVFGELEFWFAIIKVIALVVFLVVGVVWLVFAFPVEPTARRSDTGFSIWPRQRRSVPNGLLPAVLVVQGVVFAYAAIELVGTASGETQDPEKVVPRAINTVDHPHRRVLRRLGRAAVAPAALHVLQGGREPVRHVLLVARQPAGRCDRRLDHELRRPDRRAVRLNAGLYSTGRALHSMGMNGSAPKLTTKMSKGGVPFGGILLTAAITRRSASP